MSMPRASLMVATYEMPRHLTLVIEAIKRQSFTDFEVIICDDGSGPETRSIVERFKASTTIPVEHVWQEHRGFRKCRMLNEGLRRSRGPTLVFLDGDCVPHRDYVRDHVERQEPGRYLAGRRCNVGEKLAAKLTPADIARGYFDRPRLSLIRSALEGDTTHLQRSIRIPFDPLRNVFRMGTIDDMVGCNYSVAREHLFAINGFDEEYEGYGREDTDVEIRLQNLGLRIKSMKGVALQFHVWHPRREFTPANDTRLEEARRTRRVRCERGLTQ